MGKNRYLWLIGITLVCILGIAAWKTPQGVVTVLAKPQYADSSRTAVQRYWSFLDTRQLELAEKLILAQELNPQSRKEIEVWKERVRKNPLLKLKNVEFLDSNAATVKVKVVWSSPIEADIVETRVFETRNTPEGWKIIRKK